MLLAGCAHCPGARIGLPPRPDLLPISQAQWGRVPPDVQDIVTVNDLELKRYARELESRIKLHDAQ